MKNKASMVVKNMISVISNIVKAKIMGVKSKADAVRVRLLVFSLLKSRKLSLGSLSTKIQAFLENTKGVDEDKGDEKLNMAAANEETEEDRSKAIVLYNAGIASEYDYYDYEEDDKYPDLTHSLFDEEDDGYDDNQGGSVIDLVKNSKEHEGEDFKLEDEIDHVADLFIRRFKKHVRLEKLESFKRYQAMIGRGSA